MSKVIVYHSSYGCDTGCCGHVVQVDDSESFRFEHPNSGDDPEDFAKQLVREEYGEHHVKDLDWDNCIISDD